MQANSTCSEIAKQYDQAIQEKSALMQMDSNERCKNNRLLQVTIRAKLLRAMYSLRLEECAKLRQANA